MTDRQVVLCNPVRTAIGTYGGSLKTVPAPRLGALVIRETLRRAGLDGSAVGAVVMGQVIAAFDGARRPASWRGDTVHRRRPGGRARAGNGALSRAEEKSHRW
jgi:acetyl-CoA acetyltransferase